MDDKQLSPELVASVHELSHVLLSNETLETTLQRVVGLAQKTVKPADAVSVTLLQDGKFHSPVSTDEAAFEIDRIQYQAGGGPCVESTKDGYIHQIDSLENESRWQDYCAAALKAGMKSSLSMPLRVNGTLGALNLYSRTTNGYKEHDVDVAGQFASQAAVAISNQLVYDASRRLADQLNEALQSRDLIGRAKGILMEREGVTDEEAFEMLKKISQETNIKLRDVAKRVAEERGKA